MKLGKASWLILIAGILIIAFAGLGIARAQQLNEHSQLDDELSIIETRLSKFQLKELSSQQADLEKQLEEAVIQLEIAKDNIRQPNESIHVTDVFFEIAEVCNVEVTRITSSGETSDELGDIICSAMPLTATVTGDVSNLISFVTKLNNDFTTGIVKSVAIVIPGESEEGKPTANIQLAVYTYQDD